MRTREGLHFTIINQIHDAILLNVPINEIDRTQQILTEAMATIRIPIIGNPLKLDVDVEVVSRWGEKEED